MLSEKVILITGASGGIGISLIKNFVPKVKFIISSSRKHLSETSQAPKNYEHIALDLTSEEEVFRLFEYVWEKYNRLDILINTIGGSLYQHKLEDFPINEFNQILNLNLTTAFMLTKVAIKKMQKNYGDGGNIIHFVSSAAKKISTSDKGPYGIAKAGLARLIQQAAAESAKYNIRINGISPTYVFTPRHISDIDNTIEHSSLTKTEILNKIYSNQLLKKQLYPNDLIPIVELLAETKIITGQIYNCTLGEVVNY